MTVYALQHPDGRWLYHLPKPTAFGDRRDLFHYAKVTGVFADGQPMTALSGDWWATGHEATRLTMTAQPNAKTVGYRLTDPTAESVRYPATLTVDEWNDRRDREENLWELYTNVQEEQPALEHVYDGPVMVLEGREPPGPDEPKWVASLPQMLTGRPEYLHLFPGHIAGLVSHLMDVFKALPRVEHVFLNYQNAPGVYVSIRVPFDPPQTSWRPYTGRKGQPLKTGRNVPDIVTRSMTLPIPDRIAADSYMEALALWEQQVEFWVRVVEDATVAACGACGGKGHVAHGSEKYSR